MFEGDLMDQKKEEEERLLIAMVSEAGLGFFLSMLFDSLRYGKVKPRTTFTGRERARRDDWRATGF